MTPRIDSEDRQPSWHLGSFLLALVYPALLYVAAALLVPGDSNRVTQWHSHFYDVRRPLFLTYLVATALAMAIGVATDPSATGMIVGSSFYAAIYSAGLASKDERVHRVLAILAAVLFLAMYAPAIYLGTR